MTTTPLDAYHTAQHLYPEIRTEEARNHLPDCLLFAVGFRETGLWNVVGDGGHGHGMFQLDDRSHTIPPGFDADVPAQAALAGEMLGGLLAWSGNRIAWALAAYNAGRGAVVGAVQRGQSPDSVTTGGNYGSYVRIYLAMFHADHIRQLKASQPRG